MSPFTTPQLAGPAATSFFYDTTRQDDMTTTRPHRRPTFPSKLVKPQVSTINTSVPTIVDDECFLSPDSPPDSCPRRIPVPAPVYRTPLTHRRTPPLRRPTKYPSEEDDIEEIVCFLKNISWCVMRVYKATSPVAIWAFHGAVATFQWFAVLAFVVQVTMSMSFSSSDRGGGFISPLVEQLTSTAIATRHFKAYHSPHPRTSEIAVLNFLSNQIDHAHNLLTVVGGLGDDAFFGHHQTNVRHFLNSVKSDSLSGGSKTEVNLTVDFRGLDSTLIQSLSPHGFIGRTISHALDEVTYHSELTRPTFFTRRGAVRESRLDSVFLLTASNLLLEFTFILSQTESTIADVEAIHRQLSRNLPEGFKLASLQSRKAATSKRPIWSVLTSQRRAVEEDSILAYMVGLDTAIANLRQLKAYLEWVTSQLSQWSLLPSNSIMSLHTGRSCSSALREMLDRANSASKKLNNCCRCHSKGPTAPTRVELNIPGSHTL